MMRQCDQEAWIALATVLDSGIGDLQIQSQRVSGLRLHADSACMRVSGLYMYAYKQTPRDLLPHEIFCTEASRLACDVISSRLDF